jgi:hypothetical protein
MQLPEQSQAAEIQHDEAMLHTEPNEAVSLLAHPAVTMTA